jgi:cobyrinic acid a,c-diamide synthase
MEDCSLESRHLGLVTAKEIDNLQQIVKTLARQVRESVDLEGLLEVAESAGPVLYEPLAVEPKAAPVRIGIARDRAFCFYYEESLDLLRRAGAEIVFFSPLEHQSLPEGLHGLIFGGGYPELYVEQLAENKTMINQIKKAIDRGIPCLAECGGFMYLQEELVDKNGKSEAMVGAIAGSSFPQKKLGRFGYIELTAKRDNVLCEKGQTLRGHEFHYWDSSNTGQDFMAEKPLRKTKWDCIVCRGNLLAGYPHIYLTEEAAKRFVATCRADY